MNFYSLIDKIELKQIIKEAKKSQMKDALNKLRQFDAMNEKFLIEVMPDNTPKSLIRKRVNKLLAKKHEKDLRRLLS